MSVVRIVVRCVELGIHAHCMMLGQVSCVVEEKVGDISTSVVCLCPQSVVSRLPSEQEAHAERVSQTMALIQREKDKLVPSVSVDSGCSG